MRQSTHFLRNGAMMNGFPSEWLQRLMILWLLMPLPAKHIAEESGSDGFPRVAPSDMSSYLMSVQLLRDEVSPFLPPVGARTSVFGWSELHTASTTENSQPIDHGTFDAAAIVSIIHQSWIQGHECVCH